MNLHCFKIHRCYSIPFNLSNVDKIFWGWIRKTVSRFRKRKRKFCDVFTYSLKRAREIREFHVAIVQRWLTNVQKRVGFKGLARRLTFFPANTSAPMKQICERPLVSVIDFSFPEQCFFSPNSLNFPVPSQQNFQWGTDPLDTLITKSKSCTKNFVFRTPSTAILVLTRSI